MSYERTRGGLENDGTRNRGEDTGNIYGKNLYSDEFQILGKAFGERVAAMLDESAARS